MTLPTFKENTWYRDGKLLYTVKPAVWREALSRQPGWANHLEIRFTLKDTDLVKAGEFIERVREFLNQEPAI
jgi:hypothetical protein